MDTAASSSDALDHEQEESIGGAIEKKTDIADNEATAIEDDENTSVKLLNILNQMQASAKKMTKTLIAISIYVKSGGTSDTKDLPDTQLLMAEASRKVISASKQLTSTSIKLYEKALVISEEGLQFGAKTNSIIPTDFRVERCLTTFMLSPMMLETFWSVFQSYDFNHCGYITLEDYYGKLLEYPRSSLTDSMMNLIDSKSDNVLNFGEYVELTCTFACFEQIDLLKYFFYILDAHKTGLVEKNEVKHFIVTIWNKVVNSNIKEV